MALITHIQRTARKIRVLKKTAMEVSWDERLFSIWTKAAGAETGLSDLPADIQLDREQAAVLHAMLGDFLGNKSGT